MRIVHDMTLSKEQIRKFNQCRLFKRITFLGETLHHDLRDPHPDLWDPTTSISSNINERFPLIEVPSHYWALWQTVLSAIHISQAIPIRNLGPLHTKSQAKWLASTDLRCVYQLHDHQYSVHKITSHSKSKFQYALEPLFYIEVTVYDHLFYVTPTSLKDAIHNTYKQNHRLPTPATLGKTLRRLQSEVSKLCRAVQSRLLANSNSHVSPELPVVSTVSILSELVP